MPPIRPDYQIGNIPGYPGKSAVVVLDAPINGNQGGFVFVGNGGDVNCIPADNTDQATGQLFKNVPAGQFVPVRCSKVLSSNTTAQNMQAVF